MHYVQINQVLFAFTAFFDRIKSHLGHSELTESKNISDFMEGLTKGSHVI